MRLRFLAGLLAPRGRLDTISSSSLSDCFALTVRLAAGFFEGAEAEVAARFLASAKVSMVARVFIFGGAEVAFSCSERPEELVLFILKKTCSLYLNTVYPYCMIKPTCQRMYACTSFSGWFLLLEEEAEAEGAGAEAWSFWGGRVVAVVVLAVAGLEAGAGWRAAVGFLVLLFLLENSSKSSSLSGRNSSESVW